jgi:hypothetical protein
VRRPSTTVIETGQEAEMDSRRDYTVKLIADAA